MAWRRILVGRDLLLAETYRLLKAVGSPMGFTLTNGTTDTTRSYTETDTTSLQFFDLRVANGCEELSVDEFPGGG